MTHAEYIRLRHDRRKRIPNGINWRPDFLPNLIFWLDASKIIDKSNGEAISIWEDQSTQQNHAVMTTGSMQPTFVKNGSISAVRFDGANYLETTNNLPGGSGTLAIYAVFYPTDRTNRSILGWGAEVQYQFQGLNLPLSAGDLTWVWWSYDATPTTLLNVQNDIWHYVWLIYSVNSSIDPIGSRYYREIGIRIDGEGDLINFDPFASPHIRETQAGKMKVGMASSANVPFLGDIAEIIIYDPAPNNDSIYGMLERYKIEHYFKVKYGL